MATEFGKFTRKLRVDNEEQMVNMASKLKVSISFLSQVENGKRKPPKDWEDKIQEEYMLNNIQLEELKESIFVAINNDSIDITSYDDDDRNFMLYIARRVRNIDETQKEEIYNILNAS